jgi:hypothetical protein
MPQRRDNRLSLVATERFGEVAALLMSLQPTTNHKTLIICHAASHFSPITSHRRASDSSFETIRIKGQSMQNPGVLWFMIKQCKLAIKFRITIEELLRFIQKLLET